MISVLQGVRIRPKGPPREWGHVRVRTTSQREIESNVLYLDGDHILICRVSDRALFSHQCYQVYGIRVTIRSPVAYLSGLTYLVQHQHHNSRVTRRPHLQYQGHSTYTYRAYRIAYYLLAQWGIPQPLVIVYASCVYRMCHLCQLSRHVSALSSTVCITRT